MGKSRRPWHLEVFHLRNEVLIETVVKSLQGLATKRFKASDVSGPVGIVSTMGKNIEASETKTMAVDRV